MRTFLYRYELMPMVKRDLSNGIKYLDKHGVMTREQLALEINRFAKRFCKIDKLSKIFGKDLTDKNRMTMQGLEVVCDVCDMLGANDTSCVSIDLINDSFINAFLDFKREQEKERNNISLKTKQGYISFMYQHLDDREHFMEGY